MSVRILARAALLLAAAGATQRAGAAESGAPHFRVEKTRAELNETPVGAGRFALARSSASLSAVPDDTHRYTIRTPAGIKSAASNDCSASAGESIFGNGFEDSPLVVL